MKLNESKTEFIKLLQPNFGIRENLIEQEIGTSFRSDFYSVIEDRESEVNKIESPLYTNIIYNEIFNEKALKFLSDKQFNVKIKGYIDLYEKLVDEKSTMFMKGTFNHFNADTVTRALKDNKFFDAKHSVRINGQEIVEVKELEDLIKSEKDKILNNPELKAKFDEIDKALNANVELRKFRSYVESNREIIKELSDLGNFKRKLILNYIAAHKNEYNVLLTLNKETKKRRQELIEKARKEQEEWKKVIDIFKRRFTVPFEVDIKNQADVILKNDPASLLFRYFDGTEKVELGGAEIQKNLSTGEQRVFYLLDIIFEIETRKKINKEQLVIVDDIADSFDYKNKYAIVEYLKDIIDESNFKVIILTHNFDFYKTVKSRLSDSSNNSGVYCGVNNWEGNWKANKKNGEIILTYGEKNDVFKLLRKNYGTCELSFICCIPFVRNLIEFTIGKDCINYLMLTSLLHLKPESNENNLKSTEEITKSDILQIFNGVFGKSTIAINPEKKLFELIIELADDIIQSDEDVMDIKSKICLSIAIRLKAEKFMLSKITTQQFIAQILTKETGKIVKQFKKEFPNSARQLDILDRVNLMTPENIHVNSFMYEPIMDLSEDHLRKLYIEVDSLGND